MGISSFPHLEITEKIVLALAVGLFVGLEREWAHKETGVRTFSLVALFGMLISFWAPQFMIAALAGMFLLVMLMNIQSLMRDASLEMTTSAALLVTLLLGGFIGLGHYFTAVTSAILMTALLAWKTRLAQFAGGLQSEEIRSAILLGLLSLVVLPLLPDRFIDPWKLLNPREAWMIVVVIAGLGFANYVLLKTYGMRGTYYSAFLGGLVNSTAAAAELSNVFRGTENSPFPVISIVMVTSVAMFLRNLVILALFAPASAGIALLPLGSMSVVACAIVWTRRDRGGFRNSELHLDSPVSLIHVLKFAAVFVAISIAGALAARHLGDLGFLALSGIGGLVSSASTTATAAALNASGKISPYDAGVAVVLTSMASVLADVPFVYRQISDRRVSYRLGVVSVLLVSFGFAVLGLTASSSQAIQRATVQTMNLIKESPSMAKANDNHASSRLGKLK